MEDDKLIKTCKDFHIYLMAGELKDIDSNELYYELQIFKFLVKENTNALQSLSMLKKIKWLISNHNYCFLSLIMLIVSASAVRSFSKLKLIKNYLKNIMLQTRLTRLSTIKSDINETIN